MINSFPSSSNSFLFQIEFISLWISERIALPPALISSAGIWSIPGDLCLFSFSIANSTSKALGSGTSGSAACISVCLTSLTLCTSSSWEKWFLHLAKIQRESVTVSPFSSLTMLILGWEPFWRSLMLLIKSLIFLVLVYCWFQSSSILAFRYSFFLFLKCLPATCLKFFRLCAFTLYTAGI